MPVAWTEIPNNTHQLWYKDAGLRANVFYGLGLCLVIATNPLIEPSDGASLLGGFQAIPSWINFFNAPKGNRLGLYAASYFLPSCVTSYIGEYLSKTYGRRWAVLVGMFLMLVGGFINAFAVNIAMWIVGRAIIGAGVGVMKVGAPVLIQEIAHPRLRPTLGSCYQAFAYIGQLVGAWMCFAGLYVPGNWGWRFPSLLQVIGPAMVIPIVYYCPESPRWLYKQGRVAEAQHILAKYHANGDVKDPLVQLEITEINAALQKELQNSKVRYTDFLKTPGNRRRLIVLIALAFSLNWVGNGIISYYLAPILRSIGITAPIKVTLINAGLATWNLIIANAAAINVDRFGRRPLFLTSVAGMLMCYAIIMGLSAGFATTKIASLGTAVIPFLYIYFGFYSMAFTPLPIAYTVEIMPTSIRSKGIALFTSVATFGNAFNQFVNPVALAALAWKYYAVYLAVLVFYGVLIYFMFPETKRLTAEEAAVVFDYGCKGQNLAMQEAQVVEETETDPKLEEEMSKKLDKRDIDSFDEGRQGAKEARM